MRSPSDFVDLVASRCWWCGAPDLRTLTRFSGGDRHDFRGPNSKLVKSKPSMCTRCNNVRSQPFDAAWDRFGSYLVDHEAEILARRSLDLQSVFGADWRPRAADVERYVVKHLICRIVDQLPRPICLDPELLEFLDGGAYPSVLELDLCIDLGVVEMLRVARAAPPPEEPEAADAGFLGTTDLWVQQSKSTGEWFEPQGGLYYRWMGIFWKIGDRPAESAFAQALVPLGSCEDFFGPDFRTALSRGASAEGA